MPSRDANVSDSVIRSEVVMAEVTGAVVVTEATAVEEEDTADPMEDGELALW